MLECMKGFTGGDIDKLITEKMSEKFREVKDEEQEIKSRKLYLVVFGIPESQGVSTDAHLTDDRSELNSIMQKDRHLEPDSVKKLEGPYRIGKYDKSKARPRPLKFVCKSIEQKQSILKVAHEKVNKFDSAHLQNVYFQSNLTRKQRDDAYHQHVKRRENASKRANCTKHPVDHPYSRLHTTGLIGRCR